MHIRPRRNRLNAAIRALNQETHLTVDDMIFPLFLLQDPKATLPISSMPDMYRMGLQPVLKEIEACVGLGIKAFVLFPVVPDSLKDRNASYSHQSDNFYLEAIREIKKHFPQVCIITDVAMDPYSSDGHDGLVENGEILNDETLPILAEMSLAQAAAGADILGPSDMMDGRVEYIRDELDDAGYTQTAIMSYTAKYASAFYGPFRDALDSAPKSGDKKTYQMNPANRREAVREAELDEAEGADYLMVKPALAYLDIISDLKEASELPIVAYQVSGEYAMIKAAAQKGWLNEDLVIWETLIAIKRAGASLILTYFAKQMATMLAER